MSYIMVSDSSLQPGSCRSKRNDDGETHGIEQSEPGDDRDSTVTISPYQCSMGAYLFLFPAIPVDFLDDKPIPVSQDDTWIFRIGTVFLAAGVFSCIVAVINAYTVDTCVIGT